MLNYRVCANHVRERKCVCVCSCEGVCVCVCLGLISVFSLSHDSRSNNGRQVPRRVCVRKLRIRSVYTEICYIYDCFRDERTMYINGAHTHAHTHTLSEQLYTNISINITPATAAKEIFVQYYTRSVEFSDISP